MTPGHPAPPRTDSQDALPVVFALGDSVMQGAGPDLYATLPDAVPGIEVDAAPSRQFWHADDLIRQRSEDGRVDVFVIGLGTNGTFSDATFDDVMAATGDAAAVFVNVRAPREWEESANDRLAAGVARHASRAHLANWHRVTAGDNGTLLKQDGFHLTRPGAAVYADLIAATLRAAPHA